MESHQLNPWLRANLETFNPDTLNLVPLGRREEYIKIMKELAHAKEIGSIVLEHIYSIEQERNNFFNQIQDNLNHRGGFPTT